MEDEMKQYPGASIPDDLVVEILARLPAKSLCRFKCVSQSWRALIDDPSHRRRLAQTLCGFFFSRRPESEDSTNSPSWGFTALSEFPPPGVDTALSFLPRSCGEITLMDSCNGLLLLRCSGAAPPPLKPPAFYVVCNPATGEWVALPQPSHAPGYDGYSFGYLYIGRMETQYAALGFDPAVSSHFHVFQFLVVEAIFDYKVEAMEIYSSETNKWILRESRWSKDEWIVFLGHMTYFNGFLHFASASSAFASVDTNGESWRVTGVPLRGDDKNCLNMGVSQGHLRYMDTKDPCADELSIYVLEDQSSEQWTLKKTVSMLSLFGSRRDSRGRLVYEVAACHPDGDLIFFYDRLQERLLSYDVNKGTADVIRTIKEVGRESSPFFPYVPLYTRALS